jgi:tetratricopeptide (TPR) repeat protein
MLRFVPVAVALALSLAPIPGRAAPADDFAACVKDGVAEACTRAIASGQFQKDKLAALYNIRGSGQVQQGNYDGGLRDYSKAIELDPKNVTILVNRASLHRRHRNDLDRALADYNEAVRVGPKDPSGYTGRALVYAQKGDFKRAVAELRTSISLTTDAEELKSLKTGLERLETRLKETAPN